MRIGWGCDHQFQEPAWVPPSWPKRVNRIQKSLHWWSIVFLPAFLCYEIADGQIPIKHLLQDLHPWQRGGPGLLRSARVSPGTHEPRTRSCFARRGWDSAPTSKVDHVGIYPFFFFLLISRCLCISLVFHPKGLGFLFWGIGQHVACVMNALARQTSPPHQAFSRSLCPAQPNLGLRSARHSVLPRGPWLVPPGGKQWLAPAGGAVCLGGAGRQGERTGRWVGVDQKGIGLELAWSEPSLR